MLKNINTNKMFKMVDHKTSTFSIFSIPTVKISSIISTKSNGSSEHCIIIFLSHIFKLLSKVELVKIDGFLTCLLDICFIDV
jgi:hypothetical protein